MSTRQHAEWMRVIALAGKTEHRVNALQAPVDEVFSVWPGAAGKRDTDRIVIRRRRFEG